MRNIYFDITDIVEYSSANKRVSGIQRVQARLIASATEINAGNANVFASFWNAETKQMCYCDPTDIFNDAEFDSIRFRAKLGLLHVNRYPTRKEIRRALAPYRGRKIKRTLRKIKIYFYATFARKHLQRYGIQDNLAYSGTIPNALHPLDKLDADDSYIFLGANWCNDNILHFAKTHKDAGGNVFQLIHDLIPYYGPEFCGNNHVKNFRRFLDTIPSYASHFFCVSNWTRKELQSYLKSKGIHADAIVTPLAHEFLGYRRNYTGSKPDNNELTTLAKKPFVLCVGTIEGRKNISTLLETWQTLARENKKPPTLVLAGRRGWDSDPLFQELEKNSVLISSIHTLLGPSDKDLAYLYENCLFTIFPSHYEGWGLPVGEAAWFGKYVIASNATSVPEVCGELIDYIDPKNTDSVINAVKRALQNPAYVASKAEQIRRSNLRKWDDVAMQLLDIVAAQMKFQSAQTATNPAPFE